MELRWLIKWIIQTSLKGSQAPLNVEEGSKRGSVRVRQSESWLAIADFEDEKVA